MGNANGIATNVEASTSTTSEAAGETIDPDLSCLICHEDFDLEVHLPKVDTHSNNFMITITEITNIFTIFRCLIATTRCASDALR